MLQQFAAAHNLLGSSGYQSNRSDETYEVTCTPECIRPEHGTFDAVTHCRNVNAAVTFVDQQAGHACLTLMNVSNPYSPSSLPKPLFCSSQPS